MKNKVDAAFASQIIHAIEEVCGHGINFISPDGTIFSSSDEARIGDFHEIGYRAAQSGEVIEVSEDNEFDGTKKGVNIPIFYRSEVIAVIGISGEPDEVRKFTKLAERIALLLIREQELAELDRAQKQKNSFIIQSLTSGQITNRSYLETCLEELNLKHDRSFRIVLVRLDKRYNVRNVGLLERYIEKLFDCPEIVLYSYMYPNEYIALFDEHKNSLFIENLRRFAGEYREFLKVGVGDIRALDRLSHSYDNAVIAVKSIQKENAGFCLFDTLDMEILFGNIPEMNRSSYLSRTIKAISGEDKQLLRTYFEEDMSLQNTCERLFIHKNTLQYRLNHIHAITGYNPRKFRNAVILYLALKLEKQHPVS